MCNMVWFLHLFIRFFRVLHVFQVLLILPPSWKWTKSPFWRLNLSSRALFSPKVMGGRVGEASVFWDSGWANPMFFRIFFRGGPPHPLQTLEAGYEKTLRVISHGRRDNNTFPSLPPPKKWDVLKKFVLYSLLTISGKWIRLCERISDFYFFESFGKNVIDNSIFVGWFLPKSWLSQFLMVSPSTSIHPWHMEGA